MVDDFHGYHHHHHSRLLINSPPNIIITDEEKRVDAEPIQTEINNENANNSIEVSRFNGSVGETSMEPVGDDQ